MVETRRGSRTHPLVDDGTGLSQAEVALLTGVSLVGAALVLLLRAVDRVLEAWPLPTSRVRR